MSSEERNGKEVNQLEHNIDTLKKKLYDRECKLTHQRRVIMEIFSENTKNHLSAEDVYAEVKKTHPEIGFATIYRTLDLFAELDILQKIDFGDGRARYEFSQSDVHHHHHLICLKCHAVAEFDDDLLDSLEAEIARKSGFKIVDHQLKFYGYCERCK